MRPSPGADRAVGMEWYATDGAPCPAKMKAFPEDFVVEEQLSVPSLTGDPRPDYLPFYRVEKRMVDTMHMAAELSDALRSRVSYAGLKDKNAVAVQYVTPTSRRSARPLRVVRERFTADLVGYLPRPLSRSALVGNRFSVVLRECCPEVGGLLQAVLLAASRREVPNYYGLQRFGSGGPGTQAVGKAMVMGEFREAVRLMVAPIGSGGQAPEAQAAFEEARFDLLVALTPRGRDVELAVATELARHPGDWVKALRAVPVKLRRLFVQAYQSFIFNKTLSLAVEAKEDLSGAAPGDNWAEPSHDGLSLSNVRGVRDPKTEGAVPMVQVVGYAFRDYGSRFDALAKKVLEAEGVRAGQFYIEELQEVSQEGGFRRPDLVVREMSWGVEGQAATVKFTLPRGQYATVLLREIVKPRKEP